MKIVATLLVVCGVVAMFLYSGDSSAAYYKHVHEISHELPKWSDKNLQVHGFVEAGSIKESIRDQTTYREFVLESEGKRILVKNQGTKPDTFKDLAEVVAKGRLIENEGTYVFEADELMAKCPSKYEESGRTQDIPKPGVEPAQAI